jgi:uncharacterized protein
MPTQSRRRGGRYLLGLLVTVILGITLAITGMGIYQALASSEAFFRPVRLKLCCTPADLGLTYEDALFETQDGLSLRGWYLPSKNGVSVMVAHGLSQTRETTFHIAEKLHKHGYGALAFDIRGHGESDGEVLTNLHLDGLAAVEYLQDRPDVNHIAAYGFSLGGVLVVQAAAQTVGIEAVVTDGAGFTEFEDMPAPNNLLTWMYLPYDLTFFYIVKPRYGNYAPLSMRKAVAQVAPRSMLFISSDSENRMVEGFYQAAGQPKEHWYIQGVNHGEGVHRYPEEYEQKMIAFYDAVFLNRSK